MGQDHDDNMHFIPPPPPQQHNNRDEFNGFNNKIMITAIVSLSFVITLIILLHIYARCLIRRQERRTAALRQLRMSSSSTVVSVNHLITGPPRSGLDPAVIASLPIFPFKEELGTQIECSVCLSLLEQDEMVRKLTNCNHTFHAECIDTWFRSQSTCPVCRTEAEPRSCQRLPESCDNPAPTGEILNGNGRHNEVLTVVVERSSGCEPPVTKVGESSTSRLSSFRRILSRERERSSRRVDGVFDLERQQQ